MAAGLVGDDPVGAVALVDERRVVADEAALTGLLDKDDCRRGILATCQTSEISAAE